SAGACGKCKFCGPRGLVLVGANQFKLHNSDRSVKEISSVGGATPLPYRARESEI
ncbi:hypothetical protein KR059_011088, partial [Drosophila kikkawai]